METTRLHPPAVKRFDGNNSTNLSRRKTDGRTVVLFIRIRGYLRGCFLRGAGRMKYKIWNKHQFAKTSGYSVKHLERMFPHFATWCDEFYYERVRLGRANRVKVTQNFGVKGEVPGGEIRARLVGAILAVQRKIQVAHVDGQFLRKFCGMSKLPRAGVAVVWSQLTTLPGLDCRWRGRGRGRKFVVARKNENSSSSHPQTSPGLSSPTGRRDQKLCAAAQSGSQADRELATLAQRADGDDPQGDSPRVSAGNPPAKPPDSTRHESRRNPSFFRPESDLPPLQICGRWISSRRLFAKAVWLAVDPLKKLHAGCERVEWRFAHARNFAFEALTLGYAWPAIVAAWAAGVRESHEDALDADRLPGGGYASQRPPSAAKVYAIRALRTADNRPAEVRWQEFFAAPYAPRVKTPRAAAPAGSGEAKRRKPSREELSELRRQLSQFKRADYDCRGAITAGELKTYLAPLGLTLAQFNQKPRRERQAIISRATERKKENGK